MQIKVSTQWQDFQSKAYPTVNPNSEQYQHLRRVFYCAWFDSLMSLKDIGADESDEEQAAKILQALENEVTTWIKNDIEKVTKEQGV